MKLIKYLQKHSGKTMKIIFENLSCDIQHSYFFKWSWKFSVIVDCWTLEKHPSRDVFKMLLRNFFQTILRHGCSPVNLLHIFRTPSLNNTSGWLFLTLAMLDLVSKLFKMAIEKHIKNNYVKYRNRSTTHSNKS